MDNITKTEMSKVALRRNYINKANGRLAMFLTFQNIIYDD